MNEKESLAQLRLYAAQHNIPIIRPLSQDKLTELVRKYQPSKVLEIGTATGYSTALFLLNAPCTVNTVDISESAQAYARHFLDELGLTGRVNFFCGDSAEILPRATGKYDMIFLDGAKSQYLYLLPYLLDLLRVGGVLIADNVLYMGLTRQAHLLPAQHKHITIARNLAEFLSKLQGNSDLATEIYEIEDGLTVSVKLR